MEIKQHPQVGADNTVEQKRPDPNRVGFFAFDDAPSVFDTDMVTELGGPGGEQYAASLEAGGDVGSISRLLFRQAGEEGMSILQAYLKPGLSIPRHTHDADCCYYIVYGELWMGNRVLRQGDGVFVPAGHSYTVAAGEDVGAEFLEIRPTRTSFDMQVREDTDEKWDQLINDSAARSEEWSRETDCPSRATVVNTSAGI
jgi:quercetin dioxygenase-like cupin family protein